MDSRSGFQSGFQSGYPTGVEHVVVVGAAVVAGAEAGPSGATDQTAQAVVDIEDAGSRSWNIICCGAKNRLQAFV